MLFGAVGGAWALFLQFGSIMIALATVWIVISSKTQIVKEKIVRSLTMSTTQGKVSPEAKQARQDEEEDAAYFQGGEVKSSKVSAEDAKMTARQASLLSPSMHLPAAQRPALAPEKAASVQPDPMERLFTPRQASALPGSVTGEAINTPAQCDVHDGSPVQRPMDDGSRDAEAEQPSLQYQQQQPVMQEDQAARVHLSAVLTDLAAQAELLQSMPSNALNESGRDDAEGQDHAQEPKSL